MRSIDVHDLPEPVAQAIAETVRNLRRALVQKETNGPVGELPRLPGIALPPEQLRRKELYRDVR